MKYRSKTTVTWRIKAMRARVTTRALSRTPTAKKTALERMASATTSD